MDKSKKFSNEFFAPLMAVVGGVLLAFFSLFALMVNHQNLHSSEDESKLLNLAISQKIEFISTNLRDYSIWTDAVVNLSNDVNKEWANSNIGPYLYNNKGYTHNFIINTEGKSVYSSHLQAETKTDPHKILGSDFDEILAKLNSAHDGDEIRFAQITLVDGQPALVAASAILPSIGESYSKPYGRRYMIVVEPINADFLQKISTAYSFEKLQYLHKLPDGDKNAVPLLRSNGQPVGFLKWQALRPGDALLHTYLPWLLLIPAIAGILGASMFRRATRLTKELEHSEATAIHQANHDALTGLANRRALREMGMRQPTNRRMALIFLDLDGFKEVNDIFGHQAGDVLLQEAAGRLRAIVAEQGLLARVGGDEFAVLLTNKNAHVMAAAFAQKIVEDMALPFSGNHIRMVVSASVGIAYGGKGQSVDDLTRFADVAMYAAKSDGKNCWREYDPQMDEGRATRKLLESELRDSVDAGDIEVLFQPIMNARESSIASVEALARWTSPTQGPVGPAIFIPIAEESDLIVRLGELVLRKACMAARDWDVTLSVNLSPAQFWHRSLVNDISKVLQECGFPPERLELEITEGYLLSRPELATEVIKAIRARGIRVALDDFGTGFASIGFLRKFELDRLKLDRSFVELVDNNYQSAQVTKAVISLSHALELPITAEGVETNSQATFLTLAGCERLQGWHFGRAVSGAEIEKILAKVPIIAAKTPRLTILT